MGDSTQNAYLVAVAVVAILVGTGLTALSRTDFAQRGMNGVLAWTQSTGMPMRPAMSTMMTTDIEPVDSRDAHVHVRLEVPTPAHPGQATRVVATVLDADTGKPVKDLTRSHEVWMHLIATRDDLGTFAHVHPEPTGRPGELAVEMVFPTAGRYIINTEFRRRGEMTDIHDRQMLSVTGPAAERVTLRPGPRSQVVDGVRVQLHGTAEVDRTSRFTFSLTDEATGRPLNDLRPYLAAAGHVVIMSADGDTFGHEHADVKDSKGRPVFALPGQRFGPRLDVHTRFDTAGVYQLWAQFRLADGRVITAPFTVEAS